MIIGWVSGGITSAVACKIALELYDNVELVYIDTGSHHADNDRFLNELEKWYCQDIKTIKSEYKDHFHMIEKLKFINSAYGAECTRTLKKKVRKKYEYGKDIKAHVWGFHYGEREIKRAEKIKEGMPKTEHLFPLIEKKITKENALCILDKAGIKKPTMYKLGYNNNNCIGCVKGGMGYWNKIRQDFPEQFKKMAGLERFVGRSCIKNCFLDELKKTQGREVKEILPECGIQCEMDV